MTPPTHPNYPQRMDKQLILNYLYIHKLSYLTGSAGS